MIFGYARVSKYDQQTTDLQIDLLKRAGCEKIYEDQLSDAEDNRPGLKALLAEAKPTDSIYVEPY